MAQAASKSPPKPRPPRGRSSEAKPLFELSRLMVVAVKASAGQLVYRAQTKPNGPWEADWTPIDASQRYGLVAAGLTGDGRVAVIAQPWKPAGLFYIDEAADSVSIQRWNKPVDLGLPSGIDAFMHIAMALDVGARLELFGTDTKGNIWWKYQNPTRIVQKKVTVTPPGTTQPITITVDEVEPPATPWSNWMQIPGVLGVLRATRNADGRIALFGTTDSGNLFRSEQRVAQALEPPDWTDWVRMDDNNSGTITAFAAGLDAQGAVNLFAVSHGAQILHARQSPPNGSTWTGWTSPGYSREGIQAMAVGLDGDGHFLLAATDRTKFHNINVQRKVDTQQWTGWMPFQLSDYPTELALNYNADGRLTLFSHWLLPPGMVGGLWCTSQMALNSTEWELAWTELANGDINHFAVVRDLTPPSP